MKYCLILFLFLSSFHTAWTQNYSIKGKILDGRSKESIPNATILLLSFSDSIQVDGMISDLDGNFTIENIKEGEYLLKVQYLGYEDLIQNVPLDRDLDLNNLLIRETATNLSEVTISARRATGTQKSDTTLYNADAFKTMKDASAQVLIEKLPGVLMVDGALQAQGENITQILVDGKPFFGGDVKTALQNLPAEVILSIEIFDQKSDQALLSGFDDGNRQKTINIITKPNRRKGQFGRITAGYGTDERYLAGASINAFNEDQRITFTGLTNNINLLDFSSDPNAQDNSNPQNGVVDTNILGLNFSDEWGEKVKISSSYLFRNRKNIGIESLFREFVTSSQEGQTYVENSRETRTNQDHRFDMRLEYQINENNRIIFRPSFTASFDKENSAFIGESVNPEGPLNRTENTRTADNKNYDIYNRLYYGHSFDKKGRSLTLRLRTANGWNRDVATRRAENTFFQPTQRMEIINQQITRDRIGTSWETGISYTEPVGKNGQLELEYEIGNRIDDSDQLTFDIQSEDLDRLELDTALSNSFGSKYLTQEVELGYQYKLEKLQFQVEGQFQHARLDNSQLFPAPFQLDRVFKSFLPTVRFDYKFSDFTNMEIDYDTDVDAPSVQQLQTAIDNSNPLQLRTGNPNLNQSYSNRIRLRFRSRNPDTDRSWFVFAQSRLVANNIANSSFIAVEPTELPGGIILEKGSQLFRPVNLDGFQDFRSWVSYGMPLGIIKSNMNVYGGLSYNKRPGQINEVLSFNNSNRISTGVSISSNISDKIDFNVSTRFSWNKVNNTLNPALDNTFFNQRTRLNLSWIIWEGLIYRVDLNHQINKGLSAGFDNNFLLMNMSVGKKIFKNQRGEISLNVYDLLGQNANVRRNVTDIYLEDVETNVLSRYFMLTLSYNLRRFSKGMDLDDYNEMVNSGNGNEK